jgi:peptide/nickel transport system substrate-binding protein
LLRAAGGLGAAALVGIPGLGGGAASAGSASRLAALRAVLQEGQPGGTLIACIPFDLWSIYNPLIGQSDNFVFDTLWHFDPNLVPTPQLAESYEVSEDGKVYTIHLVKNATWHDGQPVTAHDVVFTWQTMLKPDVNFPYKFALQVNGEGIQAEAVDDYTVKLTLPAPNAALIAHLAAPWIFTAAPKHLLEGENPETSSFNTQPIGNGPFKFKEQVDGDHQTLVRNDAYYGGAPLLDELITRPITDLQARVAAFQAGEIDVDTREEDLIATQQIASTEGATSYVLATPYVQQFTMNNADPVFADPAVRKAIAHAMDRAAMVRTVVGDEAYAALSVMGTSHWAYNPNVPTYEYDPEKAKAMLDEAGWVAGSDGIREKDGVKLSFLNQPWRDFERNYAPLIQQYLQAVGIEMKIETVPDYATVQEIRVSGKAQSLFYGSIDYEPGELHQYFHSSQVPPAGLNLWNYSNPEVDSLLEQGNQEVDIEKRKPIYAKVQELIMGDCATIPLHIHLNNVIVRTDRVGGYAEPTGNWLGVLLAAPTKAYKKQ